MDDLFRQVFKAEGTSIVVSVVLRSGDCYTVTTMFLEAPQPLAIF